ncbi:MAG: peptidoglycan-binding protein [Actinobacteria bacterium]|nr:peptidoglycan-binding protein [Actinomycetota bacterium]
MNTFPILQHGDRNAAVRVMQYLLEDRGITVTIDGIFGPNTETAVKGFQADNDLQQDGIVGKLTWSRLIRTLQEGSNGAAVKAVQVILSRIVSPLDVDGIFGPNTEAAVKGFQADNGLQQDGIIGPQTWRALTNAAALDSED